MPAWGWCAIIAMVSIIAIAYAILSGAMAALGEIVANSGEIFAALLPFGVLAVLVFLYFLPGMIASQSPRSTAIFVANLFFGWTIIGWAAVLVWALAESGTAKSKSQSPPPLP